MNPGAGSAGCRGYRSGRRTHGVKPGLVSALKEIGLMGGLRAPVDVRSADLGSRLQRSQQSASNMLKELENEGLISRQMGSRGQRLSITADGLAVLRRELSEYLSILRRPRLMRVRGSVITGLGEGGYYVARDGYRERFRDLLGFEPHPGTLNLSLEGKAADTLAGLESMEGVLIEEFRTEGRTFGAVRCFRCSIKGVGGAVIIPLRTHHRNVMEIISPHNLRIRLGLNDGDAVEVDIEPGGVDDPRGGDDIPDGDGAE